MLLILNRMLYLLVCPIFDFFTAIQGNLLLLRGPGFPPDQEQNSVLGVGRQRQPVGQPQVQLRQFGPGPHVPLRPLVQRWMGLHHVPRSRCGRAGPAGTSS